MRTPLHPPRREPTSPRWFLWVVCAGLWLGGQANAQEAVAPTLTGPKIDLGHSPEDRVLALVDVQAQAAPWPQALDPAALRTSPYGDRVLSVWKSALLLSVPSPPTEASGLGGAPSLERSVARLQLCLIAKAQDRHHDAWRHFRALIASPPHAARALPYLWPGIPFGTKWERPSDIRLPMGVTLAPSFPPQPEWDEPMPPGPQRMHWHRALTVGGHPLDLRATLQSTGYEIDLVQGAPDNPALPLTVVMPKPRNFRRDLVYSDWERTDDADEPVAVTLPAQRKDAWTIFERLKPDFEAWPGHPHRQSPWRQDRKLQLIVPSATEEASIAWNPQALAQHLTDLLELPVHVSGEPSEAPERTTQVHLAAGTEGLGRVRLLLSSVEEFLLTPAPK